MFLIPEIWASSERIVAGFSTRHGGVSPAPYASLNLGLSTNDAPEHVCENRRRLFAWAGVSLDRIAIAGQVHGTECRVVRAPGLYRGVDALVTRTPGLVLCLTAADCASVLLADEAAGVVGACHAGWRGAAGGIVEATIQTMQGQGARPYALRVYVSPCISKAHFEVGEEVAAQFEPRVVHNMSGRARPHVDLKGALFLRLVRCGVRPDRIEISPHCTFDGTDLFFSHRAERGVTGRMMGFIGQRLHPREDVTA